MDTLTRSRELEALRQLEEAVHAAHQHHAPVTRSIRVRAAAAELIAVLDAGEDDS